MSKTPKKPAVPAKQFVIFDPPIPGFEERAEVRKAVEGETVIDECDYTPCTMSQDSKLTYIVLTPIRRIEDLLPPCKVECWAAQDQDGMWSWSDKKLKQMSQLWTGENCWGVGNEFFNPFGLPVEPNPNWRDTLYHFTPETGWKKVESK